MIELIVFLLLVYGITNIIVFGSIFEWLRKFCVKISPKILGKLIRCPMCLSMWVGMFVSYVFILSNTATPMTLYGVNYLPVTIFFDGCLSSGGVWLIHTIQEYFEKK